MTKSDLPLLNQRSLNTLMLLCVLTWFAAQQNLIKTTIGPSFIDLANDMSFKPRVPPPLIDPELIDGEMDNVDTSNDRLLQN